MHSWSECMHLAVPASRDSFFRLWLKHAARTVSATMAVQASDCSPRSLSSFSSSSSCSSPSSSSSSPSSRSSSSSPSSLSSRYSSSSSPSPPAAPASACRRLHALSVVAQSQRHRALASRQCPSLASSASSPSSLCGLLQGGYGDPGASPEHLRAQTARLLPRPQSLQLSQRTAVRRPAAFPPPSSVPSFAFPLPASACPRPADQLSSSSSSSASFSHLSPRPGSQDALVGRGKLRVEGESVREPLRREGESEGDRGREGEGERDEIHLEDSLRVRPSDAEVRVGRKRERGRAGERRAGRSSFTRSRRKARSTKCEVPQETVAQTSVCAPDNSDRPAQNEQTLHARNNPGLPLTSVASSPPGLPVASSISSRSSSSSSSSSSSCASEAEREKTPGTGWSKSGKRSLCERTDSIVSAKKAKAASQKRWKHRAKASRELISAANLCWDDSPTMQSDGRVSAVSSSLNPPVSPPASVGAAREGRGPHSAVADASTESMHSETRTEQSRSTPCVCVATLKAPPQAPGGTRERQRQRASGRPEEERQEGNEEKKDNDEEQGGKNEEGERKDCEEGREETRPGREKKQKVNDEEKERREETQREKKNPMPGIGRQGDKDAQETGGEGEKSAEERDVSSREPDASHASKRPEKRDVSPSASAPVRPPSLRDVIRLVAAPHRLRMLIEGETWRDRKGKKANPLEETEEDRFDCLCCSEICARCASAASAARQLFPWRAVLATRKEEPSSLSASAGSKRREEENAFFDETEREGDESLVPPEDWYTIEQLRRCDRGNKFFFLRVPPDITAQTAEMLAEVLLTDEGAFDILVPLQETQGTHEVSEPSSFPALLASSEKRDSWSSVSSFREQGGSAKGADSSGLMQSEHEEAADIPGSFRETSRHTQAMETNGEREGTHTCMHVEGDRPGANLHEADALFSLQEIGKTENCGDGELMLEGALRRREFNEGRLGKSAFKEGGLADSQGTEGAAKHSETEAWSFKEGTHARETEGPNRGGGTPGEAGARLKRSRQDERTESSESFCEGRRTALRIKEEGGRRQEEETHAESKEKGCQLPVTDEPRLRSLLVSDRACAVQRRLEDALKRLQSFFAEEKLTECAASEAECLGLGFERGEQEERGDKESKGCPFCETQAEGGFPRMPRRPSGGCASQWEGNGEEGGGIDERPTNYGQLEKVEEHWQHRLGVNVRDMRNQRARHGKEEDGRENKETDISGDSDALWLLHRLCHADPTSPQTSSDLSSSPASPSSCVASSRLPSSASSFSIPPLSSCPANAEQPVTKRSRQWPSAPLLPIRLNEDVGEGRKNQLFAELLLRVYGGAWKQSLFNRCPSLSSSHSSSSSSSSSLRGRCSAPLQRLAVERLLAVEEALHLLPTPRTSGAAAALWREEPVKRARRSAVLVEPLQGSVCLVDPYFHMSQCSVLYRKYSTPLSSLASENFGAPQATEPAALASASPCVASEDSSSLCASQGVGRGGRGRGRGRGRARRGTSSRRGESRAVSEAPEAEQSGVRGEDGSREKAEETGEVERTAASTGGKDAQKNKGEQGETNAHLPALLAPPRTLFRGFLVNHDGTLPQNLASQLLRNREASREDQRRQQAFLEAEAVEWPSVPAPHRFPNRRRRRYELAIAAKRVKLQKSRIHGYGVYAVDWIKAGETIMEYVGQAYAFKQRKGGLDGEEPNLAEIREARYDWQHGNCYIFSLEADKSQAEGNVACTKTKFVDATDSGNLARYINHSCEPNCESVRMPHNAVAIVALRDLLPGEELFYDYHFSDKSKEVCLCGARTCTGNM
ncbi:putative histone lysine methyltransferase, SET [Toxoplasma gondii GT1]|uniref:Putative histone lysine methyltransferase, SET n=2 Tax=Toxoplasma gondii TaxID=5811 RepID=S7W1X7_TOXGG|nr:putative histone lysine methyltransferase, SET [Toxoplasma gondii GT1]KAF4639331.1 putative histone lysine methyltransferase, SET [Toxoplasma gondii]